MQASNVPQGPQLPSELYYQRQLKLFHLVFIREHCQSDIHVNDTTEKIILPYPSIKAFSGDFKKKVAN